MSRTPARVTQADIARVIRAAKQTGAAAVEIMPDGTFRIDLGPAASGAPNEPNDREAKRWLDFDTTPPPTSSATSHVWPPAGLDDKYGMAYWGYTDDEWEAYVRSRSLGKREIIALGAYHRAKGTIGHVKGGGLDGTARLTARGFVEIVQQRDRDRSPIYGITAAGEAEWLRLSQLNLRVENMVQKEWR